MHYRPTGYSTYPRNTAPLVEPIRGGDGRDHYFFQRSNGSIHPGLLTDTECQDLFSVWSAGSTTTFPE